MPHSRALRVAVSAAPFIAAAGVVGGVYASVRSALPDPMATHFPGSGAPDGFSSAGSFLVVALIVILGTGAVCAGAVGIQRATAARWGGVIAWGTAGLLGSVLTSSLLVNAHVANAHDVRLPWWHLLAGCGVAVVTGALGWLLTRGWPDGPVGDSPERPTLPLDAGENAVWVHRAVSWPLTVVSVAMLLCGTVAVVTAGWWGLVLVGTGLLMLCFTRVQVLAGAEGVVVSTGTLRWPRVRIPLERIESAELRHISAIGDFGGWGYRIRPGASGVVLRSGEALVVRRDNGKDFVVTVDDAATAAALLNSLVARAGGRKTAC
ncbi:DUF1648 domain-containing protein [Streptomyces sp. NPDC046821]|uniref:DUF1648 domain-containing protein n=1 Tax=Streptomyces sp. NPDC046821 TaxID=3154702 RepID=UPI0033FE58D2